MKNRNFLLQGGAKLFFSDPPIGWSENVLREGDFLERKSAYGYPSPFPPLAHVCSYTSPFSRRHERSHFVPLGPPRGEEGREGEGERAQIPAS